MPSPEYVTFANREQWRDWLEANHASAQEAWLLIYKRKYRTLGLSLDGAVEEALCFGWIDSTLKSIDEKSYALRFSPRKSDSVWAVSNIKRIENLIATGKMSAAGMKTVAEAKESGAWDAARQRENVDTIPEALYSVLRKTPGALAAYQALTDSRKKQYLYWLQDAKREETRNRRIQRIMDEILDR